MIETELPLLLAAAEINRLPVLLTTADINRKIIAVNPRTLKRWQAAGKIEGRLINGKWRFNRESVLAYLSGSRPPSQPEPVIAPSPKRPPGRPRKGATK